MGRILIFIDQLNRGGAGRVASVLANLLSERGYQVSIASDYVVHQLSYDLDRNVSRIQLNYCHKFIGVRKAFAPLLRLLEIRRIFKSHSADIVIAFMPRMFRDVKVGLLGMKVPVIASDHTSMERKIDPITDWIRHHFYSVADAVTILTEKDKHCLGHRLPNKVVVYNPLTFAPIEHVELKRKVVLCVGTISFWHIKGFDRILKIWQNIHREYPEWWLEIAGPGNEESFDLLRKLCSEYEVEDSVIFLGQVEDMQSLYQSSSIFALPSRIEGFPMALIEAMSQGCACVSFEIQGAVREIINDGVDGIIVSDNDCGNFENQLRELMLTEERRNFIAVNAIKNVSRFSQQAFVEKWESIMRMVKR